MATKKIRYLVERRNADGTPRYYWSPSAELKDLGWQVVRLRDSKGRPIANEADAIAAAERRNAELDAWYVDQAPPAIEGAPVTKPKRGASRPGTVDDLIDNYRGTEDGRIKPSRFWQQLADKTRYDYGLCLDKISEWAGDKPRRAIDAGMVNTWYEQLQPGTPAMANAIMRVGRLLWNRAGAVRCPVAFNPFEAMGLIGLEPSGKLWPVEAVDLFVEVADRLGLQAIGDAIFLNEWLGQRASDVLKLPRLVRRDGSWIIRQGKTGAGVDLPIGLVPRLTARLEAAVERQKKRGIVSTKAICRADGSDYSLYSLNDDFNRVREAAAAEWPAFECDYVVTGRDPADPQAYQLETRQLQFMHLRHTAVTRLVEAECTDDLIAAISGHSEASIKEIKQHYVIRTGRMARLAFQKRIDFEAKRDRRS